MIYRKILKMKSKVSSISGCLEPDFGDFVDKYGTGINFVVHQYNKTEGYCVVEAWCSDHPCLEPQHRKSKSDLALLEKDSAVLEVMSSHPSSPTILGRIAISTHDSVDETNKDITLRGKKGKYIRKEKHNTTAGKEQDEWILDEG